MSPEIMLHALILGLCIRNRRMGLDPFARLSNFRKEIRWERSYSSARHAKKSEKLGGYRGIWSPLLACSITEDKTTLVVVV